jgi:hypothetical protein
MPARSDSQQCGEETRQIVTLVEVELGEVALDIRSAYRLRL